MADSAHRLEAIESPCVGVCSLDDTGYCTGCRRSREEIGRWLAMSPDERRVVMAELPGRARRPFDDEPVR